MPPRKPIEQKIAETAQKKEDRLLSHIPVSMTPTEWRIVLFIIEESFRADRYQALANKIIEQVNKGL